MRTTRALLRSPLPHLMPFTQRRLVPTPPREKLRKPLARLSARDRRP